MGCQPRVPSRHKMVLRNTKWRMIPLDWVTLPGEVRVMILETICHQRYPGWASLAVVCREWNEIIAKRNFAQLHLRTSCLGEFEQILVSQRDFVKYIYLDIELPSYTCAECRFQPALSRGNNRVALKQGIWKIFSALSTWLPAASGLTLEINATCPSDSEHWFKNYCFQDDDDINRARNWHDPAHGWMNGHQVQPPPTTAYTRLFHDIGASLPEELPQVNAITGLMIRRHFRHQLSPMFIASLLKKLGRLEHFNYEHWPNLYARQMPGRIPFDISMWLGSLPQSVKRLSLFEDFDEDMTKILHVHRQILATLSNYTASTFENRSHEALAHKSLGLEQLSASFVVHAGDFFRACSKTWMWQQLQTLSLTSPLLQSGGNHEEANMLLHRAGIVALQMPKLKTLVLWDGRIGNACSFVYRVEKYEACITWRGTWSLEFHPDVVAVWEKVASQFSVVNLRIEKEKILEDITSHGDAIHYLQLPLQVVEPGSLWQIRKERNFCQRY